MDSVNELLKLFMRQARRERVMLEPRGAPATDPVRPPECPQASDRSNDKGPGRGGAGS